jgi:hypothetical protein
MLDRINRPRVISLVVSSGEASAALVARRLGLSAERPAVSVSGFTDLLRASEFSEFLAR